MGIKERAAKNFSERRYNCCQAVICAYCEENGIKDDDLFKATEGFGAGMGGLLDTCGAVTGMFMAMGLHSSAGDKSNPLITKMDTYSDIRLYAQLFKEQTDSIYCRDLKREENGVKKVSCLRCVETAAELLEKYVSENQ